MNSIAENTPDDSAPKPRVPYGNQFDFGFELSEIPTPLYRAAESLNDLVINGHTTEWQDVGMAEQIVIQREALAFCRRALDEVEIILDFSAARAADHFRRELARLEKTNLGAQA